MVIVIIIMVMIVIHNSSCSVENLGSRDIFRSRNSAQLNDLSARNHALNLFSFSKCFTPLRNVSNVVFTRSLEIGTEMDRLLQYLEKLSTRSSPVFPRNENRKSEISFRLIND